jgi:hypothetical protein
VFSIADRDRLRQRLQDQAEQDDAVVGAAYTGSHAGYGGDEWSDTDLVLAVRGELATTMDRWTRWLASEFDLRHHWDLPTGPSVVRVFLLGEWLELDLTFAPAEAFGPRGPQWRTVFGKPQHVEPFGEPDRDFITGLAWHHTLHAWICLRRGLPWQAEHWISALRDQVITLACLRLGLPAAYAKSAHLLPDELTRALEQALVRDMTEGELRRALSAAVRAAVTELDDPALVEMLLELAGDQPQES